MLPTVLYGFLFLSFSPDLNGTYFDHALVANVLTNNGLMFPSAVNTITEADRVSALRILVNAVGSGEMGLVGLFGLGLWFLQHPRIAIGYGPLLAFAALAYFLGNRFVFFASPMLWFGAAFLLTPVARIVCENVSGDLKPIRQGVVSYFLLAMSSFVALTVAWTNSPINYVPQPSFPRQTIE